MHGFFEVQLYAVNDENEIFETKIVTIYADESVCIEDKSFEHPNAETLKLREEAYDTLCELKLQQDKLDGNMKLLLETDISTKADKAETLAEYGITDAYTKSSSDKRFGLNKTVLFDKNFVPLKLSDLSVLLAGFASYDSRVAYVFIPSTVTLINSSAFLSCPNLTDVFIDNKESNITVKSDAFDSTVNLHYSDDFNANEHIIEALSAIDNSLSDLKTETENLIAERESSSLKVSDVKKITDVNKNYPSVNYLNDYYYSSEETDELLEKKANRATTLDGYNITDAYSKNEADAVFAAKTELSEKYGSDKIYSGSCDLSTDSSLVTSLICKYQRIDQSVLIQFSFNTTSAITDAVDISFSGLPFKNNSQVSAICITPVTKLMCPVIVTSYNTTMTVSLPQGIKNGERIATSVFYITS